MPGKCFFPLSISMGPMGSETMAFSELLLAIGGDLSALNPGLWTVMWDLGRKAGCNDKTLNI